MTRADNCEDAKNSPIIMSELYGVSNLAENPE
jgi:hypothetical protein